MTPSSGHHHRYDWFGSLAAAAALSLFGSLAEGATVKKVSATKALLTLDSDEGAEKGAVYCIYNQSGKRIDCGTVVKSKGSTAIIKLANKKKSKKIKPGMQAKLSANEPTSEEENTEEIEKTPVVKQPVRIRVGWFPSFATPSTYAKISYKAPDSNPPSTLWSTDKRNSSVLAAVGLEAGIPVGAKAVNLGARYRIFTPGQIDSDYVNQVNPYARTEEKATALGLWAEYSFVRLPFSTSSSLATNGGLDIDQTTVTVKVTKKDDTGATPESTIAAATAKLTVVSIRLSMVYDYMLIKSLGLFLGANLQVPITSTGKTFQSSFGSNEERGLANSNADFQSAVDHKKNSVGIDMSLGLAFAF